MTSSECKVCKRETPVGFLCIVRVGATWIEWRECPRCWFAFTRACAEDAA